MKRKDITEAAIWSANLTKAGEFGEADERGLPEQKIGVVFNLQERDERHGRDRPKAYEVWLDPQTVALVMDIIAERARDKLKGLGVEINE